MHNFNAFVAYAEDVRRVVATKLLKEWQHTLAKIDAKTAAVQRTSAASMGSVLQGTSVGTPTAQGPACEVR